MDKQNKSNVKKKEINVNFHMDDSPNRTKWIIISILLCLIIALFIGLTIWFFIWANQKLKPNEIGTITDISNHNNQNNSFKNQVRISGDIDPNSITNLGLSTNANGIDQNYNNEFLPPNLIKVYNENTGKNEYTCSFPFFGPYCSREYHDPNYVAVGTNSDIQNLNFETDYNNLTGVNNLSYINNGEPTNNIYNIKIPTSGQSCTGICNSLTNCKGIIYDSNKCSIITSDITLNENISSTNLFKENPTIFINNKGRIKVLNKVFLYSGYKPFKFWIGRNEVVPNQSTGNSSGFVSLDMNIPIQLTWVPERIVNESHLIGIWSTTPFKDIQNEINKDEVYVDKIGYQENSPIDYALNLPDFITKSSIIYVGYITKDNLKKLKTKYVLVN